MPAGDGWIVTSSHGYLGHGESEFLGGVASMTQLAAEYDQRMLGNGYCNRPSQLDCQFESICETCAYYTTDTTFDPVLVAQRDHAAQRDQQHRVDLFQMLIDRNHQEAS